MVINKITKEEFENNPIIEEYNILLKKFKEHRDKIIDFVKEFKLTRKGYIGQDLYEFKLKDCLFRIRFYRKDGKTYPELITDLSLSGEVKALKALLKAVKTNDSKLLVKVDRTIVNKNEKENWLCFWTIFEMKKALAENFINLQKIKKGKKGVSIKAGPPKDVEDYDYFKLDKFKFHIFYEPCNSYCATGHVFYNLRFPHNKLYSLEEKKDFLNMFKDCLITEYKNTGVEVNINNFEGTLKRYKTFRKEREQSRKEQARIEKDVLYRYKVKLSHFIKIHKTLVTVSLLILVYIIIHLISILSRNI